VTDRNSGAFNNLGIFGGAYNNLGKSWLNTSFIDTYFYTMPMTIEAWVKYDLLPSVMVKDAALFRQRNASNTDAVMLKGRATGNTFRFDVRNAAGSQKLIESTIVASIGSWYYVVGVINSTTSNGSIYINGTKQSATNNYVGGVLNPGTTKSPDFGAQGGATSSILNGTLDELRFSDIQRSSDWINLTYQLIAYPNTWVTYGIEENASASDTCTYGGSGNWAISLADSCNITSPVNVNGNITFTNTGYAMFNSTINMSNLMGINNNTGATLYIGSAAYLILRGT
jgi:hypothetical protein